MPNLFSGQYKNLASKGRFGDTMLAHINPQEAGLLRAMGGAGTINPQTGLREFYGYSGGAYSFPQRVEEPLPSLGQALAPESLANLITKLNTTTVPAEYRGLGGFTPASEKINPEYNQYADRDYAQSRTGAPVTGYTISTEQTFQGIPLVAQYDAQGNFKQLTLEPGKYLTPDPSQPNIASVPRINAKGEIIDYGVIDLNKQDSGSFGSMLREIGTELGPIILAALAGNFLNPATGGLLSPAAGGATAADIAASNALAQANLTNYAGTQFSAIPSGIGFNAATGAGTGSNFLSPELISGAGGAGGGGGGTATTGLFDGLIDIPSVPTTDIPVSPTDLPAQTFSVSTPNVPVGTSFPPVDSSILQRISNATGIDIETLKTFAPSVIQGLTGAVGSVLTAEQAKEAARTQADAQVRAAQIAADAARFRPVGVTTRFGSSNFTTDAAGNVVTAGYTPSAEITGYQDRLSTIANQNLTDVEGARAAYQPLTGAAQTLFGLGQGYLAKTPEQAAADYISKQQALLAPSQENQLAQLQNKLFQQGRGGAATAQGGGLMATSPELAAYYNSLAQSNLVLSAQADQEAQNRIKFGASLFDTGAGLQGKYYAGQTAAYLPFTTAIDTSSGLERLAQQPLDLSTSIGQNVSTANANVGRLTGQGIINAASTMAPANAYSAGGNLLSGAANSPVLANAVNRTFGNTPSTQQTFTFNSATGQFIPVQQSVFAT